MAVTINIKCKSEEEMFELRDQLCFGLSGSPAFINNEIVVSDFTGDPTACMITIGNCNKYDIEYDVNSRNFLKR